MVPYKCRISCSISEKKTNGILKGTALNVDIALGSKDILTILMLPTHEHGISYHSTNLYPLQVHSSVSYSLQSIDLSFL